MTEFYSCGKLLITGEYLILRGARGLALPTSRGQRLKVTSFTDSTDLTWRAFTADAKEWFSSTFSLSDLKSSLSSDNAKAKVLERIFHEAKLQNPNFLQPKGGLKAEAALDFPRNWGLGSSSTLVHLIAQWANVNAFDLQQDTLGGSGYDVMVAAHGCPIVFSRTKDRPVVEEVQFDPPFKDKLWFVHCGHKQDSAQEVTRFGELKVSSREIDQVSRITDEVLQARDIDVFERLLREHDFLMSRILAMPSASEEFVDFQGMVKYLGAWGGDFMLAMGEESDMDYFREKGMNTILSYQDMIKQ